MAKPRFDWRKALAQAVDKVRADAAYGDWYAGYKAGASAVAVEMARIEREHATHHQEQRRHG